jgi:dUTP pyrophosphatase
MMTYAKFRPVLSVTKFHPDAKLPVRNLDLDVGYDLYANRFEIPDPLQPSQTIEADAVGLRTGDIVKVYTDVGLVIPDEHGGFIKDRSGLGSRGLHVLGGVIDPSYRGNIVVCLINLGRGWVDLKRGDRVAQLVVLKTSQFETAELTLDEFSRLETARQDKGFGSSGR